MMHTYRTEKQRLEDDHDTSSEDYHAACRLLEDAETEVGPDWDGVTVLEDNGKPPVTLPKYICDSIKKGDIRSVLRWINDDRSEDRANAVNSPERMGVSALALASINGHLALSTLLLQLGANINIRESQGLTLVDLMFNTYNAHGGQSRHRGGQAPSELGGEILSGRMWLKRNLRFFSQRFWQT